MGSSDGAAIRAVVFDLDGVIRHFDPEHRAGVEQRHGLEAGLLGRVAFAPDLGHAAVTGGITRKEWVHKIGEAVGAPEAAKEWLEQSVWSIDPDMVDLIDRLRGQPEAAATVSSVSAVGSGLQVCLLTNGTDEIPAELAAAGIEDRFDRIFNTADIGVAKPAREIYDHVATTLSVAPHEIFFTDDSAANIDGAQAAGWRGHHFAGWADLEAAMDAAGIAGFRRDTR